MNTTMSYHVPVLLNESVDALAIKPDGVYVDATFGGGGHSREILSRLGQGGRLFAFDQDSEVPAGEIDDPRFTFVGENFRYMSRYLRFYRAEAGDGILADLGVSSHQFDTAGRGFSIRYDGPLDMRMNPSGGLTAAQVVNEYEAEALADLFYRYGELRQGRALARQILRKRPIATTGELMAALEGFAAPGRENKFFAQVFQALRIAVNDELGALEDFLTQSGEVLREGGRLSVISYHSLEDRLVKNFIRSGRFSGEVEKDFYGNPLRPLKPVERKAIVPSEREMAENSRARSARLRVGEKVAGQHDKNGKR